VQESENSNEIITITQKAIIAIKEFMLEPNVVGDGLRVGIRGGGCAGFEYVLDFSNKNDDDIVSTHDGITVYIDPVSAMHLEGVMIDYIMGLSGTGFKFINPYASTTCGCGNSFA